MEALGMVEVVGLVAGIEAADVACKTANVSLVGYELAKGGGLVTIKVLGQVGAVTAAVDAAAQAAARITRVVSTIVIPRPNGQVEPLVYSAATKGYTAGALPGRGARRRRGARRQAEEPHPPPRRHPRLPPGTEPPHGTPPRLPPRRRHPMPSQLLEGNDR
jgi:ethanolamine utilization protein EutM